MSTRQVLAANLKKLMEAKPRLDTLRKITAESGGRLSNGKLDRIRRAANATDIDALTELAKVFGVQPWQLLVPNLNPKALPQIEGAELLESIKSLVLGQTDEGESTDEPVMPRPVTKRRGRFPSEVLSTGHQGEAGEVDKPGKVPRKGSRRGA